MNIFEENVRKYQPLASRMRPIDIKDFIGQRHLIYQNSFLCRAIVSGNMGSCIFYGPPGTGKTTIANIIANTNNGIFKKLNAVSSGVADAKEIIKQAKIDLELYSKKTYLLLDECHRWSKAQSDCVLQAIEEGVIVFIGSTTENPYISMTRAIVSRCKVFEFTPLSAEDIKIAIIRAVEDKKVGYGNLKINIDEDTLIYLANSSCGDLRSAYNTFELAVTTTAPNEQGVIVLNKQIISDCMQKPQTGLDENTSFDMLSAFCKSLRGSDTDAALLYAQKLLLSGFDPLIIARRLVAHSSEDIGMADSNALLISMNALQAVEKLGMPECNLALSHAIIYVCEAEKSNSVYLAMTSAMEDAKNNNIVVPNHLKNHPTGYDDGTGVYKYPHNFGGYVKQQYLPTILKNKRYYFPKENGKEKNIVRKKDKL